MKLELLLAVPTLFSRVCAEEEEEEEEEEEGEARISHLLINYTLVISACKHVFKKKKKKTIAERNWWFFFFQERGRGEEEEEEEEEEDEGEKEDSPPKNPQSRVLKAALSVAKRRTQRTCN